MDLTSRVHASPCAELRNVGVQYDTESHPALHHITVTIPNDTLTLVTGPTGSGKTTLARVLAGFIPSYIEAAVEGQARVLGQEVNDESAGLVHRVGFVFDNPFDQLTGATRSLFDEVAFPLENAGAEPDEIESRVMSALSSVGLEDRAAQHPREISGGQSQRLAMATVLATRHDLVVLDDPASQLDPVGRQEIVGLVDTVRRSGVSVVVVANDLEPWLPMSDLLVVLEAGGLLCAGAPRRVLAQWSLWSGAVWAPRFLQIWRELVEAQVLASGLAPLDVDELAAMIRSEVTLR